VTHLGRLLAIPVYRGDNTQWIGRHVAAVQDPRLHERPIVSLIEAWLMYADSHQERFESTIGDDQFLGPEWAKIGASLRELLNGDLGRLDGGTLDGVLYDTLKAEGFDPEQM